LRRTSFAGSLTDLAVLQRGANTRAGIYGIVVGPSTSAKTTVTLQMADLDAKGGVGSTVDVPVTIMSLFAGAQCSLLALSPLSSLISFVFLHLGFLLSPPLVSPLVSPFTATRHISSLVSLFSSLASLHSSLSPSSFSSLLTSLVSILLHLITLIFVFSSLRHPSSLSCTYSL